MPEVYLRSIPKFSSNETSNTMQKHFLDIKKSNDANRQTALLINVKFNQEILQEVTESVHVRITSILK